MALLKLVHYDLIAKVFDPSPWMFVSGVLASIVLAQFFVWKDEHKRGQDAAKEAAQSYETLKRDYDGLSTMHVIDVAAKERDWEQTHERLKSECSRASDALAAEFAKQLYPMVSIDFSDAMLVVNCHDRDAFGIQVEPICLASQQWLSFECSRNMRAGESKRVEIRELGPHHQRQSDERYLTMLVGNLVENDPNESARIIERQIRITYTARDTQQWVTSCKLVYDRDERRIRFECKEAEPVLPTPPVQTGSC